MPDPSIINDQNNRHLFLPITEMTNDVTGETCRVTAVEIDKPGMTLSPQNAQRPAHGGALQMRQRIGLLRPKSITGSLLVLLILALGVLLSAAVLAEAPTRTPEKPAHGGEALVEHVIHTYPMVVTG